MRIALVLPVDPAIVGNGAARRAAFWRRALAELGELTTIVIDLISDLPDAGSRDDLGSIVGVPAMQIDHPHHPALAQSAPQFLGARLATDFDQFDVVVGFRSYVGLVCLGLARQHSCRVMIDLDDDDATLAARSGGRDEARRWRHLLEELRVHDVTFTAANEVADAPEALLVPNVAPLHAPVRSLPVEPTVAMLANFSYAPNAEGARWFLDEIWPKVSALMPDARLSLVGPGSPAFDHGVGIVEDLGETLAATRVTVVPLQRGSGTRLKVLDAWAHGVPVVSTAVGVNGLDASDEAALIADEPNGFADHVIRLLRDDALAVAVGDTGRSHAERDHGEPEAYAKVRDLIHAVVNPPTGPRRFDHLVTTEVDDGLVVHDPVTDVAHHLDPTAAMVFSLCDGRTSMAEMVMELQGVGITSADLSQWVSDTIELLLVRRLAAPGST